VRHITFIDDFSHYYYLYILHEKTQLADILHMFIGEVERKLEK